MYRLLILLTASLVLSGCGTYFQQPVNFQQARLGEETSFSEKLRALPKPKEPIVVGVYKFRDQTGQYKPTDVGSTFSTAVTQGATTILIKALEESQWFVPIERENLSNLLNERNIIRSTRNEYQKNQQNGAQQLPPLLYAGILLEGGIVSYDTNILTGGLGARYFGIGGSTQYRQDRITVYLRAVSTSNGKILKTVYVSKTILSQALDASMFRYVSFRRLLEAETGYTRNEPTQIAVSEAIEKAVESLIIEGIEDQLWQSQLESNQLEQFIDTYNVDREEELSTGLYDRYLQKQRGSVGLGGKGGVSIIQGDLNNPLPGYNIGLSGQYYFNPYLAADLELQFFELKNDNTFVEGMNAANLNAQLLVLPFDKISPFFKGGIGTINNNEFNKSFLKFQYGGGIEFLCTDRLGISAQAMHHIVFSDRLDNVVQGKRDDQYLSISLGLNFYFNSAFERTPEKKN